MRQQSNLHFTPDGMLMHNSVPFNVESGKASLDLKP
jgi:hypothetical protein